MNDEPVRLPNLPESSVSSGPRIVPPPNSALSELQPPYQGDTHLLWLRRMLWASGLLALGLVLLATKMLSDSNRTMELVSEKATRDSIEAGGRSIPTSRVRDWDETLRLRDRANVLKGMGDYERADASLLEALGIALELPDGWQRNNLHSAILEERASLLRVWKPGDSRETELRQLAEQWRKKNLESP
jgi:hypothetical protein